MNTIFIRNFGFFFVVSSFFLSQLSLATEIEDRETLANLDTTYQKAVQDNDVETMAEILLDQFILVEGDGKLAIR